MSAEVAAVLRAAREKIAMPERWVKYKNAADSTGRPVPPRSSQAQCFCSIGAIGSVGPDLHRRDHAWESLRGVIGGGSIADWNDAPERTHPEVLAAFDAAIAAEEREP